MRNICSPVDRIPRTQEPEGQTVREGGIPLPGHSISEMSQHDVLAMFNEPHVIGILLYIRDNPGCRRTELYKNVARNDRMATKLGLLIDAGLVIDDNYRMGSCLKLTQKGIDVAASFDWIIRIIDDK